MISVQRPRSGGVGGEVEQVGHGASGRDHAKHVRVAHLPRPGPALP